MLERIRLAIRDWLCAPSAAEQQALSSALLSLEETERFLEAMTRPFAPNEALASAMRDAAEIRKSGDE